MNELISIILPVFNSENYIRNTVLSVLNQSYKNFELIIVNDGSTDNTKEICEELEKQDCRIKLYNKLNEGVATARNFALTKVNGDYIMFIDSDDLYNKDYVKKMYYLIKNKNVDIVRAGYNVSSSKFVNENIDEGLYSKDRIKDILIDKILKEEIKCYIWLLLIKKEVIVEFEECLHIYEDANFYIDVFMNSNNIYILNEKLYIYNDKNNNSITKSNIAKNIDNMIDSISYFKIRLEKYNCLNMENYKKINTRIFSNIINYIYVIYLYNGKKEALKKYKMLLNDVDFINIKKAYSCKYSTFKEKIFNFFIIRKIFTIFWSICFLKKIKERFNEKNCNINDK